MRDVVRLEVAALLSLARKGQANFAQEILVALHPEGKDWALDEMKKIEAYLREKVGCVDEA